MATGAPTGNQFPGVLKLPPAGLDHSRATCARAAPGAARVSIAAAVARSTGHELWMRMVYLLGRRRRRVTPIAAPATSSALGSGTAAASAAQSSGVTPGPLAARPKLLAR